MGQLEQRSDVNPARMGMRKILAASLGAALGITVLACASDWFSTVLLLGSFGSTAVILFAFPAVHFAQPRHVIGGHVLSSLCGVGTFACLGVHVWTIGLAVGLATAAMLLTRCIHPPAGSNPVIAAVVSAGWKFVLMPTLAGVVLLTLVAWMWHRSTGRHYPLYWR